MHTKKNKFQDGTLGPWQLKKNLWSLAPEDKARGLAVICGACVSPHTEDSGEEPSCSLGIPWSSPCGGNMGSGGGWVGCSMLFPTNVSRRLMVTLNPPFVGNLARTQLLNQFSTSLLSSYLQVSQGAEGTAVLTLLSHLGLWDHCSS